ncbi:MAG: hypothetical protein AB1384_09200 [Actinomycetota bacterium]
MEPGQADIDILVGLREQELRFFAKWSLIAGIGAFGILILIIAVGVIIEVLIAHVSDDGTLRILWSLSFFIARIMIVSTSCPTIIAIVLAVLGKRRLTPDSERGIRRRLNAGLVLGIIYLSLVLIAIFISSIVYFQRLSWYY